MYNGIVYIAQNLPTYHNNPILPTGKLRYDKNDVCGAVMLKLYNVNHPLCNFADIDIAIHYKHRRYSDNIWRIKMRTIIAEWLNGTRNHPLLIDLFSDTGCYSNWAMEPNGRIDTLFISGNFLALAKRLPDTLNKYIGFYSDCINQT